MKLDISVRPGMVRLVLSSIVIFYHVTKFVFIGSLAVYCFFILSGYWITLMYEKKYIYLKQTLAVFYISRIWRIFPVYFLFSLGVFLMYYYYDPGKLLHESTNWHFLLSNTTLLGYNLLEFAPLGPAWSLDIEMQFYILFPFIFFLVQRVKNIFCYVVVLFLLSVVLLHYDTKIVISRTIVFYIPFFLIGIVLYKAKYIFSEKITGFTNVLFLLVLIIHYLIPSLNSLVKDNRYNYHHFFNFYLSFLTIPFLLKSVHTKSDKVDKTLGDMSFILYLSHWVLTIPYNFYTDGFSFSKKLPYTVLFLISTFVVSYLVYLFFDRPIERLRKKWVDSHIIA